ncbi:MAG: hypothetical protein H5U06_05820 [Candidatus Aminicenantes bacterium]|nr:hypothetical protein [Candidatus Aminicenantes bacterium]
MIITFLPLRLESLISWLVGWQSEIGHKLFKKSVINLLFLSLARSQEEI